MLVAEETASGCKPRFGVETMMYILLVEKRTSRPLFCDEERNLVVSRVMNKMFCLEIMKVKEVRPDLVMHSSEELW